jgi:short-subunit dehydrogenase
VNISSIFGLISVPSQSAYNTAKFGVRGFTEALRQEMLEAGHPVQVTCVHPGGIKTNIVNLATTSNGADLGPIQKLFETKLARTSADEAAEIILRGVRRNKPRVLVGADAHFFDAIVRLLGPRYQRVFATVSGRLLRSVTDKAAKREKEKAA